MQPLTCVVAAVIEKDGRFLIARRPLEKQYGGLWEFPGGKVEPGESEKEAILRELQEEFGLTVTRICRRLTEITDPAVGVLLTFLLTETEGVPSPTEHVELRWATPAELRTIPMPPADKMFVKAHYFSAGFEVK